MRTSSPPCVTGRAGYRPDGSLGFRLREEAVLETLTQDVLKSSEIEGEILDTDQVRSSIARRLGLDIGALTPADRHVEGVVEMMLDATQKYQDPLTEERLFGWHAALFPTGRQRHAEDQGRCLAGRQLGPDAGRLGPDRQGAGPLRGAGGRPAPGGDARFLDWFNGPAAIDPVLKAALAHLWFVTIHPFDDGNGRIARAIADMALARSERSPQRFYSMSAQIRLERNDYYDILERTQKGTLDITPWMEWFLGCLDRAFDGAETTLASVLRKARFWEAHAGESFNDRQRKVLNRLLDGFEGKLTSSKWAKPRQVLAGHGPPRHQRPGQTGHPAEGRGRRPEHELLAHRTGRRDRTRSSGWPVIRRYHLR